jgi:hypothetical protein
MFKQHLCRFSNIFLAWFLLAFWAICSTFLQCISCTWIHIFIPRLLDIYWLHIFKKMLDIHIRDTVWVEQQVNSYCRLPLHYKYLSARIFYSVLSITQIFLTTPRYLNLVVQAKFPHLDYPLCFLNLPIKYPLPLVPLQKIF